MLCAAVGLDVDGRGEGCVHVCGRVFMSSQCVLCPHGQTEAVTYPRACLFIRLIHERGGMGPRRKANNSLAVSIWPWCEGAASTCLSSSVIGIGWARPLLAGLVLAGLVCVCVLPDFVWPMLYWQYGERKPPPHRPVPCVCTMYSQ
eukprot:1160761-Pelagomonas_calceolata.AAC.7